MGKKSSSKISNPQPLRALMVDDSENDVLLIIRELKKGGYNPSYERVETTTATKKALKAKTWDVILCDYKMPKFNALSAIALLKETNINIPVIIVSGSIGEDAAIECMRLGAQDYVMKGNLSRLCSAIARELEEAKVKNKQRQAESQREAALEALRRSEEKYRNILENIEDGYYEVDFAGNLTFFNDSLCRLYGYSKEELMGMNYRQYAADKETAKNVFQAYNKVYNTGELIKEFNWQAIRKDGTKIYAELSISLKKDLSGNSIGFKGIIRDVTERKQADEKLRNEEQKFRALAEQSSDIIVLVNRKGIITYENQTIERILGFKVEERIGASLFDLIHPDDLKFLTDVATILVINKNAPVLRSEVRLRHKDGNWRTFEVTGSNLVNDTVIEGGIVNLRDITERKKTEKTLKESEERYRALFDSSLDIIYIIDFDGNFIDANAAALNRFGYTREELPSVNVASLMDKDQRQLALKIIQEIKEYGVQKDLLEIKLRHKDGTPIYIETKGSAVISNGKAIAIESIARDITERKAVEKKLLESEKYFKEITENSSDIILITDKNGDIKYCSRSIERFSGYTPEELIGKSGFTFIHPDDLERAANDYSKAILLQDTAIPNGFRMIHKDGSERYLEGLGKNLLDNPDVAGFIMNVHDATESKQAEKKLMQTLDSLRKAFGVTMQVMVSAVEMRDPYTAGHQIRAADLARAIAREMGLSPDKIDGIRIAGTIHDIGKLSIPAEILSKPTKLTDIEFSLIKEHSQSGYEMLKNVESPWPLAEIIHQHHERMNGTGYPRNLKGDEILIEARILAVADVVEAMASHRPYRASLGIEAALEEIEKNNGILYDNAVADACLKLFREKNYQLPL
jgi:PAS domain S-box-containing protein